MCDVSHLNICDVLLGQTYLWNQHLVYESRPRCMIISLGNKLYRILEVAPLTTTSLIFAKKCSKIIPQTRKCIFSLIPFQSMGKIIATSMALGEGSSMQQKHVDTVMKEYKQIFSSPTGVPFHYQVKNSFNLTPRAPLPNG